MNIQGEMIIRKSKNGNGYYTSKIHKNENKEIDDKLFITVYFPESTELEDFIKINVLKGFDSYKPVKDEEGNIIQKRIYYVVQEFEIVENSTTFKTNEQNNEEFSINSNDDLPF